MDNFDKAGQTAITRRKKIERYYSGMNPRTKEAAENMRRTDFQAGMNHSEKGLVYVVPYYIVASSKDRAIYDALIIAGGDALRATNPVPAELAVWMADVLQGKIKPPPDKADKTKARDWIIARMVTELAKEFNLNPTRTDSRENGRSACDAVEKAYPRLGYQSIKKAYFKYRGSM